MASGVPREAADDLRVGLEGKARGVAENLDKGDIIEKAMDQGLSTFLELVRSHRQLDSSRRNLQ